MVSNHELTISLKRRAKEFLGADLVGIASIDRFKNGPKDMAPDYYLPDASSVIVLALSIPEGVIEVAGHYVEEGKTLGPYLWYGYPMLNWKLSSIAYEITKFLEKRRYKAIPFPPTGLQYRYVDKADFSHRHAAVAAGLGQFGWNRLLLTPRFGAKQRLVSIITNASLLPDPFYNGPKLCKPEVCKTACVRLCPTKALYGKEICKIGNMVFNYSHIHPIRCRWAAFHEKGFFRTKIYMPKDPTSEDFENAKLRRTESDAELSRQTFVPHCGACLFFCPSPDFKTDKIKRILKRDI